MAGTTEWVARRRLAWDQLTALVGRAGGTGIRSLSRDELRALGPLYRRTAADLAYARLRTGDANLIFYLNDLVTRAHGLLYAERGPGLARLGQFLSVGFPRLLRARRVYVLLAAATFLVGGLLSAGITAANPEAIRIFIPDRVDEVDFYKNLPQTIGEEDRPEDSAKLMQNNIRVAIAAFAVGILGGFPTLLLLFMNGLPIGALAVQQHNAGYDLILWSFLAPHGVPELTAIMIAGGAGMMIGHALVAPGELSRRDALTVAGRDAVRLLLGTVVLFIVAGFLESFISPTSLPAGVKFFVAALGVVGLWWWFSRGKEAPAVAESIPAPGTGA